MKRFPWWSADSSSWRYGTRFAMRLNPTSLKYQRIRHRVFGREENRKNLRVSILLEPVSGVRVYLGAGPSGGLSDFMGLV